MKSKLQITETPEYLRNLALRQAHCIRQYGWRPSGRDLAELRASTRDARAYRTLARSWRSAGFRPRAIGRLARPSHNKSSAPKAPTEQLDMGWGFSVRGRSA